MRKKRLQVKTDHKPNYRFVFYKNDNFLKIEIRTVKIDVNEAGAKTEKKRKLLARSTTLSTLGGFDQMSRVLFN